MGRNKGFGKNIKDLVNLLGIIVIGGGAGIGGTLLAFDAQEKHFANISQGLPLMKGGIHLKKGKHNVVITDQFYELLTYETPQEDKDLVLNAFKEAYKNLNKYNSKLNFNLCTTVDEVANYYNLPKVSSIGKQDIPLYVTEGVLEGKNGVMAATNWKYDSFTYEMTNLDITFRKKYLLAVNKTYDSLEETMNPYNAIAYTTALHETMHTMGFAHIDDKESIMNTYVSYTSPKDLTEYDIELLDKYNIQFYGAKSILENNSNLTDKESEMEF